VSFQHLKLDVRDHVATLAMDRPPVNALGRAIRLEITQAFDMLSDREDVRAIVFTGSGRMFCAGADIKERAVLAGDPGEHAGLNRIVREMFYSIMECSKPVIAAVNGPALGAGFALTLCCDILFASQEAFFAMPEVDVGLAGGVKFLQRHFSPSKSRRLLMTGERLPASELYRLGVIEECTAPDALMPAAHKLAQEIASKSPLAIKAIKDSFIGVENLSLRDGYRVEQNMTVALSNTEDAKEAKRAFVEKRKPVFTGR
jgi:enoyl-CoA hydratase